VAQLVVMPHNFLIVDYGLGHPGSVHDAYAFQGMYLARNPGHTILQDHWIWADSTYPSHTWCVVPFKTPQTARLSQAQNLYNKYLSQVRTGWLTSDGPPFDQC